MRSDAHLPRDRHGRGVRPMAGRRLPVIRRADALQQAVNGYLAQVANNLSIKVREVTVTIELVPSPLDLALAGEQVPLWRQGSRRTQEVTLFRRPIEQLARQIGIDEAVRESLTSALSDALGIAPNRLKPGLTSLN